MSIQRRKTQKGETRYDVRLYRPDGREYSRTFRTRKEAERYQVTERADRARGNWIDPQAGRIAFADWAKEWFESNSHAWRPRTAEKHEMALRVHWVPMLGHRALSAIQPREIQAIVNDLVANGYASASVQTYLGTITSVFADAVDVDLIGRSPCRSIKRPSVVSEEKRVIEATDLHRLADAVGPNWRCLIYIGGVMGLRFGEAAALRWSDVDFVERQLSVRRTVTEKAGVVSFGPPKSQAGVRSVAMPGPLVEELALLLSGQGEPDPEGLIFPDANGGPLRRGNFRNRVLRPATLEVGVEGLTFHGLRHTAATLWIAEGVDARTVQYRLGHSDPRLVLRLYAHATSEADRRAAESSGLAVWSNETPS